MKNNADTYYKLRKYTRLTITHFIVLIGCALTIIPLLWMLSTSLKLPLEVFVSPPKWIPETPIWTNYKDAFTAIPYLRYLSNTFYVAFVKMGGEVFVSAFVAYGFTRFNFRYKNQIFMFLLATLMIPGEITMIPAYILYSKVGLTNTYFPIAWAAYLGGSATFIFFLRMYFSSIPKELDESAYIDGASSFTIFTKIIMPISGPALVTIGIWSFMGAWNDLLGPLLYLDDYRKFTIQLGLAQFNSMKEVSWGVYMAASVVAIIPPLIIFFFGQKKLVEGIKMSGIKG